MEGRRKTENSVRTNQQVQIEWDQVNWSKVKHQVEKIQQKIFREAQAGNFMKVKRYQKLLARSFSARLLAVRLITEENRGKNTPGLDGYLCKTAKEKMYLAEGLKFKNYHPC